MRILQEVDCTIAWYKDMATTILDLFPNTIHYGICIFAELPNHTNFLSGHPIQFLTPCVSLIPLCPNVHNKTWS